MNVLKLDIKFEKDNDYTALGIITALPEYILVHNINNKIGVDFKRYDDLEIKIGKQKYSYPWFFYYFDEFKTKLYLINNNHPQKPLVTKLKNIDYFLMFGSDFNEELENIFLTGVRNIKDVTGIYKLNTKDINHIDFFIEKFEILEAKAFKSKETLKSQSKREG